LQELNAFASQQLDFDLEEEAPPAYGDAFAARPGQPDSLTFHCFDTSETPKRTDVRDCSELIYAITAVRCKFLLLSLTFACLHDLAACLLLLGQTQIGVFKSELCNC